jgi:enoyl-CoA hydratase/carnithine racemase
MTIDTYVQDGIAFVEIARPTRKNALTLDMYRAMADALATAQTNPDVRVVLIAGQPGVFTAGNDIEDFLSRPPRTEAQLDDWPVLRFMRALLMSGKPVVAAVTGDAIGIGATMLLHCDLVYLAANARLSMPFVRLGLVPEFASSALIPLRLGRARATETLVLGEPLTADEAVRCGIANAALPADEVRDEALNAARRLKALPPEAVRETLQLLRRGAHVDALLETMLVEARTLVQRLSAAEARDAFTAFLNKARRNG